MGYKIYFYTIILLLFCSTAYAGFKTNTATADIVAVTIATAPVVAPTGYIYIYADDADDDLKAIWSDGTVVVIADYP